MNKRIDLSGERFSRLVVIGIGYSKTTSGGNKITTWDCQCDCGNITTVSTGHLRNGHTKSCGCLAPESSSRSNTTHALRNTRAYRSWNAMLNRCRNQNSARYPDYGGRGISVCDRWEKFENFLADMGERPEGKTLDRFPDNDGNYEPGNCRWATVKEQNMNKRNSTTKIGETK